VIFLKKSNKVYIFKKRDNKNRENERKKRDKREIRISLLEKDTDIIKNYVIENSNIIKDEGLENNDNLLNKDEILILATIYYIRNHSISQELTEYQLKDFMEEIFQDLAIDELFFQLKKKGFIINKNNSEVFVPLYKVNEIRGKIERSLEHIFNIIGLKLSYFLEESKLLKRFLYFAQKNPLKFKNYVKEILHLLNDIEKILIIFFYDESFLEVPSVSKIIRILIKEQSKRLEKILTDHLKDFDFLKALTILYIDEILGKLGIETISINYYKPYKEILREILGESRAKEVIEKLLLLGLNETENLTDIDIKSILMKSENLLIIEKWLKFNIKKFKVRLEKNWNLFINVKNLLKNERFINFEYLFRINAIFFSNNRLFIRKEVEFAFFEVCKKIEEKIRKKVKEIDNIVILPIGNERMEDLNELEGKIIIKLNTLNWKTNEYYHPITKEVGFRFTKKTLNNEKEDLLEYPDKNFEFNAIGEVDNLKRVKSIFNTCKWDIVKDYAIIEAAKKRIWEKENPPIPFEDVLNMISKDFKLIELLYLIADKHTGITAININKTYKEHNLWSDVFENMKLRYPRLLIYIVEELARKSLLKDFFKDEREFIFQHFKEDFIKIILQRIESLNNESKKVILLFFKMIPDIASNIMDESWQKKFKIAYESFFKIKFMGDLEKLLIKIGIVSIGHWYTSKKKFNINYPHYKFIYCISAIKEIVLNKLEGILKKSELDLEEFKEKFKNNVIELIGLDFILSSDGHCSRDELRGALSKIAPDAWNNFESYDGIISSKDNDIIVLNPFIIEELYDFISMKKNDILKKYEYVIKGLLALDNIDSKIEIDENSFIYNGFITLKSKVEITMIITPWFLPQYREYLGEKNLLIITNQPDYETFLSYIKELESEFTLVFLQDNQFYLFSNFHNTDFIDSLIWQLEENNFELISKEIAVSESFNESNINDTSNVMEENGENFPENASGMDDFDPFGEIFNVDLKDFPIGLNIEEPLIIIIPKKENEEYGATIQIICRELYREFVGGLSIPKRMTEEPLEEESNVSDKIIFIDKIKAEEFGLGNNSNFNNVNWNNLGRKLQEFYSHRFGFYIIEIPFRELDYLINEIKKATQNLRPYIIIISPKLEGKEDYEFTKESKVIIKDLVKIKRKICSLIFGSVIPKEDDRWIAGKTFDNFFTSCNDEYRTRLIKLEQQKIRVENEEVSVPLLVKRVDKEGDLHYKIKIFIVKYLYEKEQCKKNSVKIEEKLNDDNITPDVHVGNTAYEVETLYGSAKPLNKIVEKVENYKDLPIKVKIVLKNWDVFIYFKHLIDLEKELREKENFDVEFMTLNLEENTLINIKELGQSFHSIFYNPKYKFLF